MSTDKKSWMQLADWLGRDKFNSRLPRPFNGYCNNHSTGCQAAIYASEEGLPAIEVWRDSVWYSHIYDFNERGKVRGIQPGCDWAAPVLEKFFSEVAIEYAEYTRAVEEARAVREAERVASLAAAVSRYSSIVNH